MTDVDAIVQGIILEHGEKRVYDARKAREYYLRTRKLVGRKVGELQNPFKTTTKDRSGPVYNTKTGVVYGVKKDDDFKKAQRIAAEKRLESLKAKVKKAPPKKRNALEKKLDALERRLKKANPLNIRLAPGEADRLKGNLKKSNPLNARLAPLPKKASVSDFQSGANRARTRRVSNARLNSRPGGR